MERILQPFPPDDNMGQPMEEVVAEMTTAERTVSSQPAVVRRRPWGTRRRTRSTGSLPFTWYQKASDDSSSSVGGDWGHRDKKVSSLHQSDSDDVSGIQTSGALFNLQSRHLQRQLAGNMESDSVNENFSPIRPNTRRKRKFKRMAVDVEMASTSRPNIVLPCVGPPGSIAGKKKRVLRHNTNCENRFCGNTQLMSGASGKRKRSSHHHHHHHHYRSGGGAKLESDSPRVLTLQRLTIRDEPPLAVGAVAMETAAPVANAAPPSNSSLSSSESDTGIFTNDEGREGDDEQSDWFGESGAAGGGVGGGRGLWEDSDRDEDMELPTFQALLTGNLDIDHPASADADSRVRALKDRLGRGHREIRGGRRRVRSEKPGFSVLTSANEKLSKFLQDPAQSELRLHPMQKTERDQLSVLAELYSLNMKLSETSHKGFTCPILTKTSNTMRVEHVSLGRLSTLGDFKRRRKTPPCGSLFNGTEAGVNCDNNPSSSITAIPPATTIIPDVLSTFDNRSS